MLHDGSEVKLHYMQRKGDVYTWADVAWHPTEQIQGTVAAPNSCQGANLHLLSDMSEDVFR